MEEDIDRQIKNCETRIATLKSLSPELDGFIPKWEAELKRLKKLKDSGDKNILS